MAHVGLYKKTPVHLALNTASTPKHLYPYGIL
jgi:hypothetical protein